jgi:protein ImuB
MFACIHAPEAEAMARSFSPFVERVDAATAVFSLTPRQLAGFVLKPPQARAAVAKTAEASILAARNFSGFTYIEPGEETRVLGALPIDVLPPEPEIFETLQMWGIRTLADLAELPDQGLAERLGDRGLWLQRLARGAIDRPLRPVLAAETYEESAEMEHPIELREPLLFLIGRFIFDLAARLKSQSLAAQAVRITLNRQERVLNLPFPTRDIKLLVKLTEHSLERQPPEEPIARVHVEMIPTAPRRLQHGLFTLAAPEPEKLELTLGKIRGLVGERNVGRPQLFNTHRPGAGMPTHFLPRLAFRYFRPRLEARVDLESGAPKHIWTRMFRGKIVQLAGPWRSSGDWWNPGAWDCDEWDLALSDGALYRLSREREPRKWFVEGVYD